jgi:hypothetical protein
MGYSDGAYVLDTSASRNSNSGHDYGVIECRETRPDRVAQTASSRDIALERQARLGLSYRLRRADSPTARFRRSVAANSRIRGTSTI